MVTGTLREGDDLEELALEGLKILRSSPAYAVARSLELWRQQEEERAAVRFSETEREMRERLEEEYRQRELQRAQSFRHQQAELRDLEQRAKRKLLEMQQREANVKAEMAKTKSLSQQARRSADLAIQSCEDSMRRQKAEAKQAQDFQAMRQTQLENRIKELEAEIAEARMQCSDLQSALAKQAMEVDEQRGKNNLASHSAEEVRKSQLRELKQTLSEERVKYETLAASRDHFRHKVEELCRKLAVEDQEELAIQRRKGAEDSMKQSLPSSTTLVGLEVDQSEKRPDPDHPDPANSSQFTLEWLQQQKHELLVTGLYTEEDAVIRALNAQMKEQTA
eukprot:Skav224373  [mRNA]  locus=scaffold1155:10529:11536:+ [translate_table: standard]